jgi:hypothetical protein
VVPNQYMASTRVPVSIAGDLGGLSVVNTVDPSPWRLTRGSFSSSTAALPPPRLHAINHLPRSSRSVAPHLQDARERPHYGRQAMDPARDFEPSPARYITASLSEFVNDRKTICKSNPQMKSYTISDSIQQSSLRFPNNYPSSPHRFPSLLLRHLLSRNSTHRPLTYCFLSHGLHHHSFCFTPRALCSAMGPPFYASFPTVH